MAVTFSYKSERGEKARLARHLSKFIRVLLIVASLLLFGVGIGAIVFHIALGWVLIGFSTVPVMILEWYHGELKRLPIGNTQDKIDQQLSAEILAKLPEAPTPKQLAAVIGTTNDGLFFAARFGISPQLLRDIASDDARDIDVLWQRASEIRTELGLPEVSAAPLIIALIERFQGFEQILAQLHIELDDLRRGAQWQKHIHDLIAEQKRPRRTGGIARDWSFGYIPLLTRFGQNISEQIARGGLLHVELDAHQKALAQLIDGFGGGGAQNALLVGPAGVGKTTIIHAFAEKLIDASAKLPANLKFQQVFMLDASALLSAAPGRGELEGLVMRVLGEAYTAKNIIICLDNAQLFFEEGVGSVDLSNVLLPILEAGNLRMILTMDEQRFLAISGRNPALGNSLSRISIVSATQPETMAVMQDQLILTEFKRKVTYTYQSLAETYKLSERYIHDLAMPGRALKLLESAAGFSENGLVTINSVQTAIEQTMDVKVAVASESGEREKLLNLESLIHERMINQVRAVEVVSDALRRARAGVRNQNRPIGTFLFLGPTGVGKTELAKALADVYFGGESRIIRLDMNEYVRNEDVARLIADGSTDGNSLTARAMKQPFSVVLLDEIEKAHPNVLTTLLQLLDEGILRDINSKEVSFRDTIVIATSNAGADRIREYIERGYNVAQFEDQLTNELINSGQFRPEFLNRFDEIVTFTPLGKAELLQVVDLMINDVNKTLQAQKITVDVAEDAKMLLVERGYDPRLGARPMRRVIQKTIENNVAKLVLAGQVGAGATITISAEQVASQTATNFDANAMVSRSQSSP